MTTAISKMNMPYLMTIKARIVDAPFHDFHDLFAPIIPSQKLLIIVMINASTPPQRRTINKA